MTSQETSTQPDVESVTTHLETVPQTNIVTMRDSVKDEVLDLVPESHSDAWRDVGWRKWR